MADFIVTEIITYRVTDVEDEDAAVQAVEDNPDRDEMFEACLDRSAIRIDLPIGTREARELEMLPD